MFFCTHLANFPLTFSYGLLNDGAGSWRSYILVPLFSSCKLPVSEPERNVSLKVEQTCFSLKILQHRPPLIQPVCEKLSAINVEELFKGAYSHLLNLRASSMRKYPEMKQGSVKVHPDICCFLLHFQFSLSSTFVASYLCCYLSLKLIYSPGL